MPTQYLYCLFGQAQILVLYNLGKNLKKIRSFTYPSHFFQDYLKETQFFFNNRIHTFCVPKLLYILIGRQELQYSQRHTMSMINHCDRRIILLGHLEISGSI